MRPLQVNRLPSYRESRHRVSSHSTLRVKNNTYTVPARLRGEQVVVRLHEMLMEVYYGGQRQLECERLIGEGKHRVDYRHIIDSLVRKPGAFARYRYRESLFPSETFRRTYDVLSEALSERAADLNYLRLLQLAASKMQSEVELVLEQCLRRQIVPKFDLVNTLFVDELPEVPELEPYEVDLKGYDEILEGASL